MRDGDRLPPGRDRVDDVADVAHVFERQVSGVRKVDLRLQGSVDAQYEGAVGCCLDARDPGADPTFHRHILSTAHSSPPSDLGNPPTNLPGEKRTVGSQGGV